MRLTFSDPSRSLWQWLLVLVLVAGGLITAAPSGATPRFAPETTELIQNGGFESDTAWVFGATPAPASYSTITAHSGSRSAKTGIRYTETDKYSYSSVYQGVAIPSNATSVVLTFWYRPFTEEATSTVSEPVRIQPALSAADQARVQANSQEAVPAAPLTQDVQTAWILDSGFHLVANIFSQLSNSGIWTYASFDLTAYRGQTIYVYFDTFNDGDGSRSWMYVDDVSVQVTTAATPTNTPTATATQTPTPTVTPTPVPGTCNQVVVNPSFETTSGWLFGETDRAAAYTTATAHDGTHSARTGITPGTPDTYTYSSVRQAVTVPSGATYATLTFWYKPFSQDTLYDSLALNAAERMLAAADLFLRPNGQVTSHEPLLPAGTTWVDGQQALILNSNLQVLAEIFYQNHNTQTWTFRSYDLLPWKGQTIYLYFNSINDGDGRLTWMFVDEANVTVCDGVTPSPTPDRRKAWLPIILKNLIGEPYPYP
ncbi:MAG: immune inhibitor A [Ardenticatenaceae bacterium]|nr:immune inhibitor A [Ardenticatenaceae bacterium]